jgi:hypothetical protein
MKLVESQESRVEKSGSREEGSRGIGGREIKQFQMAKFNWF